MALDSASEDLFGCGLGGIEVGITSTEMPAEHLAERVSEAELESFTGLANPSYCDPISVRSLDEAV
ncbi:hypothetical protein [Agrobacterium fabrum]|uniref:hypothetical protein n=1 Tax=Agrobacterium fabrum TaxID=1176649 RepID=UPI003BA0573A